MRAGEGQAVEIAFGEPAPGVVGSGEFVRGGSKYVQPNAISGDAVAESAQLMRCLWCETQCCATGLRGIAFVRCNFDIGEFPQMGIYHIGRSLLDEKPATLLDDKSHKASPRRFLSRG